MLNSSQLYNSPLSPSSRSSLLLFTFKNNCIYTCTLVFVLELLNLIQLFCDPMACSPSGSSVHGFLREESLNGLPFPSSRDLPSPRTEPTFPALIDGFFTTEPQERLQEYLCLCVYFYLYRYGCKQNKIRPCDKKLL